VEGGTPMDEAVVNNPMDFAKMTDWLGIAVATSQLRRGTAAVVGVCASTFG
jgi:hypothetical protein